MTLAPRLSLAQPTGWPAAMALLAAMAASCAQAETSPYYVGVAQALAHESNLYRLGDGQAAPGTITKSDTVATTSLVAGFDQPIGRQRVTGSVSLRNSRFANNDQLNNQGYGLNLGLEWATIERLSGKVNLVSQRNLRRFDPNEASRDKNIETVTYVDAEAHLGVVTRLTLDAGLNWRQVGYSSAAYRQVEYDQTGAWLGTRYRLTGATLLGAALRTARTHYARAGDDRTRRDLDLTVDFLPSTRSVFFARLGYTTVDADLAGVNNFRGVSGEVRGTWRATGKTSFSGRLVRDTGQDTAFINTGSATQASSDYSRTSTLLVLSANHELTAKINLSANLGINQRDLNNSQYSLITGARALAGNDTTTTLGLGARWAPTRAILLGCDISHEQRRASSTLSLPYSNDGFSCFGQFTLQGL
jgi:hypothetical protein